MKKRLKCLPVIIILLFIIFQFSPIRVYLSGTQDAGFGLLKDNKNVEFYCYGSIHNLSLRSSTVILEVSSKKDADSGLLASEKLSIKSIEITRGNAEVLDKNEIYVPPLSESEFMAICVGEYGGKGNGVRHPPSSIKVKINK